MVEAMGKVKQFLKKSNRIDTGEEGRLIKLVAQGPRFHNPGHALLEQWINSASCNKLSFDMTLSFHHVVVRQAGRCIETSRHSRLARQIHHH
jgi:hypothetical protein